MSKKPKAAARDGWDAWQAAFRTLCQNNDGRPLAALLRSLPPLNDGSVLVPPGVVWTLAELLDPHRAWNSFAKPRRLPSDHIEIVNGKLRLNGFSEREAAAELAEGARLRLIQGAKRGQKLNTLKALEKYATDTGDEEGLRAFADLRKADARVQAARKLTYNAVRLEIRPLTRSRVELLERNSQIIHEMRLAIQQGQTVTDAAQNIGEKLRLSERQVTEIWSDARKARFLADLPRGKRRQRHTY